MNDMLDAARIKARLARLVGFDTQNPPGLEAEAASYIRSELAAMGCRAETEELGDGRGQTGNPARKSI